MTDMNEFKVGAALPERRHTPTNVSLFLYNAAIWNAHRIHYDELYATKVEKHPAVVVDGPLQGDWLTQVMLNWIGDRGTIVEFEYSNRRACYIGDTLISGGKIESIRPEENEIEVSLFVKTEKGEVTAPGRAVIKLKA